VVKGIVDDVLDRGLVLLVRLDHLRPVAATEEVILPSVALIECPGVAAVQVPHSLVEVRQRGLDQQVVVVTHQAPHVSAPAVAPFDPAQDVEEDDPVSIVHHDRCVVVAADPDVVVRAGLEVTEGASHRSKVAPRNPGDPCCDAFAPRPTRSCHVPGTRLGTTEHRHDGRLSPGRFGLEARQRLWSARGAGAMGSSHAPAGACAGTACPCASSPCSVRRRRPGLLPRSAPR
jgi:hypothetical protein